MPSFTNLFQAILNTIVLFPIVSQFKGIFHIISGDVGAAKTTQMLFCQHTVDCLSVILICTRKCLVALPYLIKRKHLVLPIAPYEYSSIDLHTHQKESMELTGSSSYEADEALSENYRARWMTLLPNESRLFDICLPGTHNSHAYTVSRPVPFGTGWVLCQDNSIFSQLEKGVRLLDLRFKSPSHFGHGPALTADLTTVSNDLVEFMLEHPGQVVICLVRTLPNFESSNDNDCSMCTSIHSTCTNDHSEFDPRKALAQAVDKAISNQMNQDHYQQLGVRRPHVKIIGDTIKCQSTLANTTLGHLTNRKRHGAILIDHWNNWRGSWHQTKDCAPRHVLAKCKEWAGHRQTRNYSKKNRPQLLEFIVTIDEGPVREMIKLAFTHSIRSISNQMHDLARKERIWNASIVSNIQAAIFDYVSDEVLLDIISLNLKGA